MKTILDLCGGTGGWSKPYKDAGYTTMIVDPSAEDDSINYIGTVAEFLVEIMSLPAPLRFQGILMAPPCTQFSGSGARHWIKKDLAGDTVGAVDTVHNCLTIKDHVDPIWWALENPVGRLSRLVPEIGPVRLQFDPHDYGDYYSKRTQLFGEFNANLKKTPVSITHERGSSPIHRAAPSKDRSKIRSITPTGFAKAFFEANP